MHVFWRRGARTAAEVREHLTVAGRNRTYTTIATLVRILHDKGFLEQANSERPFIYHPRRSYEEVSRHLLGQVLQKVFRGSREQLLVRLVEQRKLTAKERTVLEEILKERSP
jgi:predicted transcriptional regulator